MDPMIDPGSAAIDGSPHFRFIPAQLELGGAACNSLKSLRSSAQDRVRPISTAKNGAPIDRIGTFATVTREQTVAPSVSRL